MDDSIKDTQDCNKQDSNPNKDSEVPMPALNHPEKQAEVTPINLFGTNPSAYTAQGMEVPFTMVNNLTKRWQIRNKERHGADAQTQAQIKHQQAVTELEMLYAYKDRILPEHNWILATPFDQRKTLKTFQLRGFIANYKPILEESYKTQLETG